MKVKQQITQRYPFNASGLESAKAYLTEQAKKNFEGQPYLFRLDFFDNHDTLTAVIEFQQRPSIPRGVYGNSANYDYSHLARMARQSSPIRGDLIAYNFPLQDFRRFRSALETKGFFFETSGLSNKSLHELKKRV